MQKIKVKPLYVFDAPQGIMNNPAVPSVQMDDYAKREFKPQKVDKGIAFIANNKGTWIVPFDVGNALQIAEMPNPIHVYFASAQNYFTISEKFKDRFPKDTHVVFNTEFLPFLQNRISSLILLHTSLEAFINSVITENKTYQKKAQSLDYSKIMELGFREKFEKVIRKVFNIDFLKLNKLGYQTILRFSDLRNDLIHLKAASNNNQNYYFKVYNRVLRYDYNLYFESVKDYMNTISPGFIE